VFPQDSRRILSACIPIANAPEAVMDKFWVLECGAETKLGNRGKGKYKNNL
jgi:hypothetical protein